MTKHLLMSMYPRALHHGWRRSVEQLLKHDRISQFDGRRVIVVAMDSCCDPVEYVMDALDGHCCEFIIRENVPGLQETAHFLEGLESLIDEPGVTLRMHSKSCTHPPGSASVKWLEAMCEVCLDYPELIDCAMHEHEICGPFRSHGIWGFPGHHSWHFAGSFWWFDNASAREKDWSLLHQSYEGIEAAAGLWTLERSMCLFYDYANTAQLYSNDFWRDFIGPSLRFWRENISRAVQSSPILV